MQPLSLPGPGGILLLPCRLACASTLNSEAALIKQYSGRNQMLQLHAVSEWWVRACLQIKCRVQNLRALRPCQLSGTIDSAQATKTTGGVPRGHKVRCVQVWAVTFGFSFASISLPGTAYALSSIPAV